MSDNKSSEKEGILSDNWLIFDGSIGINLFLARFRLHAILYCWSSPRQVFELLIRITGDAREKFVIPEGEGPISLQEIEAALRKQFD